MSEAEGKMTYMVESSDSESEDDGEVNIKSHFAETAVAVNFGDEDEEVEYFGGKVQNSSSAASDQTESKLASILFQKDTSDTKRADPIDVSDGGKDEFGIEYHSKRKKQGGAAQPSALDDFDEELLTRLLPGAAAIQPSNEEQDEFDMEFDTNAPSQNAELIAKALENASIQAQSADVVLTSCDTKKPVATSTAPQQEIEMEAEPAVKQSASAALMEDARKALAEVSEVYGSGLGDHEVLLMSSPAASHTEDRTTSARSLGGNSTALCGVIEEGDEEEAEKQEAEEELRAEESVRAQQAHEQQLESEWDSLGLGLGADSSSSRSADQASNARNGVNVISMSEAAKVWSFEQAVTFFQAMDHSARLPLIVVREEAKGGWFSSAPKPLSYFGSKEDLDLPFLVAQVDYDPECHQQHWQMLSTLYTFFIQRENNGTELPTSRRWERLGFQGSDPRTDLNRSMKMLSILQMLSFIELDRAGARRAFELSLSDCVPDADAPVSIAERNARAADDSSWPFMCVAIMFTKEALQALRKGVLNDKIAKRMSVFSVINEFHRACFAEFERMLLLEPNKHHAVHLASLRKLCESNPLKLLKRHKTSQTSLTSSPSSTPRTPVPLPTAPVPTADSADFRFDDLDRLEEQDDVQDESESAPSTSSSWTKGIFGGKAAKFAY